MNNILPIEVQALVMVKEFMQRFDYDDEPYPIGGEYFGVWGFSDEFWDFQNIITALKSDITPESLSKWYWSSVDKAGKDETVINLKSWIKGARYGTRS